MVRPRQTNFTHVPNPKSEKDDQLVSCPLGMEMAIFLFFFFLGADMRAISPAACHNRQCAISV